MPPPTKKTTAADRTVDMFTGSTKMEQQAAAAEEVLDAVREPFEGIESEMDRWRDKAFECQEWTTKHFYKTSTMHQEACSALIETQASASSKTAPLSAFRLTSKKGWMYLEKIVMSGSGERAYHYAGLMIPQMDLMVLMEAVLKASWSQSKEDVRKLFKEICK